MAKAQKNAIATTSEIVTGTNLVVIDPVAYEPTEAEMALGQEMCDSLEAAEFLFQNGLAEVILPATSRVTAENIIVPAGEIGSKERWFIKKNLFDFSVNEDKTITVVATKRQLKDRGISL